MLNINSDALSYARFLVQPSLNMINMGVGNDDTWMKQRYAFVSNNKRSFGCGRYHVTVRPVIVVVVDVLDFEVETVTDGGGVGD